MLILSRVCAEFYDKHNNLLDRITAKDLGIFREISDTVKQDPLFQMLIDDGSIKYPADDAKDKALEQDPFAGTTAEGKEIKPKAAVKTKTAAKAKDTSSAKDSSSAKDTSSVRQSLTASPQGEALNGTV